MTATRVQWGGKLTVSLRLARSHTAAVSWCRNVEFGLAAERALRAQRENFKWATSERMSEREVGHCTLFRGRRPRKSGEQVQLPGVGPDAGLPAEPRRGRIRARSTATWLSSRSRQRWWPTPVRNGRPSSRRKQEDSGWTGWCWIQNMEVHV